MDPAPDFLTQAGIALGTVLSALWGSHAMSKRTTSKQLEEALPGAVVGASEIKVDAVNMLRDHIEKVDKEHRDRSHDLRELMQRQVLADALIIRDIQGDLTRAKEDIKENRDEAAEEFRRLEEQMKENHTETKQELKEIKGLLTERRQSESRGMA